MQSVSPMGVSNITFVRNVMAKNRRYPGGWTVERVRAAGTDGAVCCDV